MGIGAPTEYVDKEDARGVLEKIRLSRRREEERTGEWERMRDSVLGECSRKCAGMKLLLFF